MPDREKAIKGLEVCTADGCNCDECPYVEPIEGIRCYQQMMKDALALLREQEPQEARPVIVKIKGHNIFCGPCELPITYCGRRVKRDARQG